MTDENQKILVEHLKELPEVLQTLVTDGEFDYFLETVGEKYQLSEKQKSTLSNELLLTFLGISPLSELAQNLVTLVGLDKKTAINLIKELPQSSMELFVLFLIDVLSEQDLAGLDLVLKKREESGKNELDYMNEEMVKKYNVPPEKSFLYSEVIDRVVFGFDQTSQLPYLLQTEVGLSKENSLALTKDIAELLKPVLVREETEMQTKKDSVASLADKIAAIKPTVAPTATPTPIAGTVPPAEFEAVKPMRTMQSDIDDKKPVHGYGALQAAATETHQDEPVVKATSFEDLRLNK